MNQNDTARAARAIIYNLTNQHGERLRLDGKWEPIPEIEMSISNDIRMVAQGQIANPEKLLNVIANSIDEALFEAIMLEQNSKVS